MIRKSNKRKQQRHRYGGRAGAGGGREMDSFIDFDMLHLYVIDDDGRELWFNSIDMGQNEEQQQTPWNPWHLKQRSTFSHFVSTLNKSKRNDNYTHFIVECNYDFDKNSWSLFKLQPQLSLPSTLKMAQDLISRIEECIDVNGIIQTLAEKK